MPKKFFKVMLTIAMLLGTLIIASGSVQAFYNETQYLGFDIVQNNDHKYFSSSPNRICWKDILWPTVKSVTMTP